MNKEIMKELGFEKEVESVEQSVCPLCGWIVDESVEFRDELSKREFKISGLCQKCQDKMFA